MNRVQFNAVMLICSVIIYAAKPTPFALGIAVFLATIFAISYFMQRR